MQKRLAFAMPKAIPDRWLEYSFVGKVIEGTRIICFKVPLRKEVLENCKRNNVAVGEKRWDIEELLKSVPKLKFIIDLTNTNRYYDPKALVSRGVGYAKIPLMGRVIPPQKLFQEFNKTVEEFLKNSEDDTLLGVHCTHGLNRTGLMVCSYLRDSMAMAPEKAIEIFEEARGYKIERENYLALIKGTEPPPPDFGQKTVPKRTYISPKDTRVKGERGDNHKINCYGNGEYETGDGRGRNKPYDREDRSFRRSGGSDRDDRRYSRADRSRSPYRRGCDDRFGERRSRKDSSRSSSRGRIHSEGSDDEFVYDYRYDY